MSFRCSKSIFPPNNNNNNNINNNNNNNWDHYLTWRLSPQVTNCLKRLKTAQRKTWLFCSLTSYFLSTHKYLTLNFKFFLKGWTIKKECIGINHFPYSAKVYAELTLTGVPGEEDEFLVITGGSVEGHDLRHMRAVARDLVRILFWWIDWIHFPRKKYHLESLCQSWILHFTNTFDSRQRHFLKNIFDWFLA